MNNHRPTRATLKTIEIKTPGSTTHPITHWLHVSPALARSLRFDGRAVRVGCALALLLVSFALDGDQFRFRAGAQTIIPTTDPNSVVPAEFRADKSWSEEGSWHWVSESFVDARRYTGETYDYSVGRTLSKASYVATRVKSLSDTDPCTTCVHMTDTEQGPPSIFGGPSNDALAPAYANLDNGPRRQIKASDGRMRWTNGAWYLNYNPTTKKFFSWTWIPDDGRPDDASTLASAPGDTFNGLGSFSLSQSLAAGARVFPIASRYVISQRYGCVPLNSGYVSSSSCPANRPSFHNGVDIAVPLGTPILAAASGTVTFAGIDPSTASGNSKIVVQLDGVNAGFENVYMHWQTSYVKVGDHVSAGQVIAAVGSVGYSTGPHLHFAVLETATHQTIDPLGWLQGAIEVNIDGAQAEGAYPNVMRWQALIDTAAKAHNVPAALIAAIMAVESGGNPTAISPAGARGLMQIMPSELTRLGVPQDKWLDPAANIDAGARYLAESLSAGASIEDAAARYFGSGCDALGTCTAEYVNHVVVLYVYFDAWFSTGTPPMLTVQPFTSTTAAPETTSAAEPSATPSPENAATPGPSPATPAATAPAPTESAAAATETATATPSPTATPSATATPSPSATPSSTATTSSTASATPTASVTPGPTATGTASPTASPAAGATPSPAAGQTADETPTPAPTKTPAASTSATGSASPTATSTATATPQPAATPEATSPAPVKDNSDAQRIIGCIVGPLLSELNPLTDATPDAASSTSSARDCTAPSP